MRKYVYALLICFTSVILNGQIIKRADDFFNRGLYKQSIEEYSTFIKDRNEDNSCAAALKTALAYSYLKKYDSALKTLYNYAPKGDLCKARYLIVKERLLKESSLYSQSPDEVIESETDPSKFTLKQKLAERKNIAKELWEMRSYLTKMPTKDNKDYLEGAFTTSSKFLVPTVYDYMVPIWLDLNTKPQEEILEESYKIGGSERSAAAELWHIERILMIRDIPNEDMAQALAYVSGNASSYTKYPQLTPYMFRAGEVLAKARAASKSAYFYNQAEKYQSAVDQADYCLQLPLNFVSEECGNIRKSIVENKALALTAPVPFNLPVGKSTDFRITTKNMSKVYMHIYPLTPDDFATETGGSPSKKSAKKKSGKATDLELQTWMQEVPWQKRQEILKAVPARTLGLAIQTSIKYEPVVSEISLLFTDKGLYAIVLSEDRKPTDNDLMFFVNFTELALYATAFSTTPDLRTMQYQNSYFNIYALDPQRGTRIEGADVIANARKYITGEDGSVKIPLDNKDKWQSLSLLGYANRSFSIIPNINFTVRLPEKYRLAVNTDRAVYMPGQKINVAVNVIEYKSPNYFAYNGQLGKDKLTVTLSDANHKDIAEKTVTLNDMGAADVSFTIPKNAMLGAFTLKSKIGNATEWESVLVEEYKEPEFEITLEDNEGISLYDTPLTVKGNASYYQGMPLSKAKVTYTITKDYFRPLFCWWYPPIPPGRDERIDSSTVTDENGNFSITFTPRDSTKITDVLRGMPAKYRVEVFVTDKGGRTLNASKLYGVSGQEKFFIIKSDKGFFRQNTPATVTASMVNADGKQLEGQAEVVIQRAVPKKDDIFDLSDINNFEEGIVLETSISQFDKEGPTPIDMPLLPEGFYVLKIIAQDSYGVDNEGKMLFIVVNPKTPSLTLPAVAIPENKVYYPGQTATFLIGATNNNSPKYIEIYKDQFFADKDEVKTNGVTLYNFPVKETHRGSLALNWFSVTDYKPYNGSASVEVPFTNKNLNVSLEPQKPQALPEENIKWTLQAKDENENSVSGQAVVTLFDKSLNYYKEHSFNILSPYNSITGGYNPLASSIDELRTVYMPRIKNILRAANYANTTFEEMATLASPSTSYAVANSALLYKNADGAYPEEEGPSEQLKLRGQSPATAFWQPNLKVTKGKASFNVKMPERLTQWVALASVFTKSAQSGKAQAQITINKDLMVSLQTPRFLREDDTINIAAVVFNHSKQRLPVEISLNAQLDGQDATSLLKIENSASPVNLRPGQEYKTSWKITSPRGTGILTLSAVAKSGDIYDGEVKTIPLLSSRQRMVQSKTEPLTEGKNTLTLETSSSKSKSIYVESANLSISPNLIVPAVRAIPMFIYDSKITSLSAINAYLPAALLNNLQNSYPQFKRALASLQRNTKTAPWNTENAALFKSLNETPFYNLSKGYKSEQGQINIFDPKTLAALSEKVQKDLLSFQNADGGFAWVSGGKSSLYITLTILERFGEAYAAGIKMPEDSIKKALKYITANVSINASSQNTGDITQALYTAKVLSYYPKTWYKYDIVRTIAMINKLDRYLTPLGKAYMASVYNYLGNPVKAKEYLEQLFDAAETSPVTGISWASEEHQWLWFNDTITTHAAAIDALLAVAPQDVERLNGLIKWLMFDSKATMCNDAEDGAKAVYAMINIMSKEGALEKITNYKINWNGLKEVAVAEPLSPATKELSFAKYSPEVSEADFTAEIEKITSQNASAPAATQSKATDSLADYATLTALFSAPAPTKPSPDNILNIYKTYYLVKDNKATPLIDGDTVKIGDEIRVKMTLSAKNDFDFVYINDPKPAAFEADDVTSGWQYDGLIPRYEELRNSSTNFYMAFIPSGIYDLSYTLRPTAAGTFTAGAAVMQSMFASEFAAYSSGITLKVKE